MRGAHVVVVLLQDVLNLLGVQMWRGTLKGTTRTLCFSTFFFALLLLAFLLLEPVSGVASGFESLEEKGLFFFFLFWPVMPNHEKLWNNANIYIYIHISSMP